MTTKALTELLSLLGDKWAMPILSALSVVGPLRFAALKRAIPGVSSRMLAQTLTYLFEAALIDRVKTTSSVTYNLTAYGSRVAHHALGMRDCG